MLFCSLTFLFFFFPLVFLLYYICPNRTYRNTVLLLFSLIFYGWGEPKFILLMLAVILIAYLGGLAIERCEKEGRKTAKKVYMIATVSLLVANLFIFKYFNFAIGNFGLSPIAALALPIGISFYTFQILSYVIDLYKKEIRVQKNFFNLSLYVSFFPQLIAGPIVRYQTVEQEIHDRRETLKDITVGMQRFIIGLAKKVIIANNVGVLAATIYSGDSEIYGTAFYWLAAVCYALQIYFDFSGYSDMAIGLGRMFGFHFLENFNYPYISLSITDFWRRWHISLSTWFRDYVYIPLGGNRVKKMRWILNLCVVWGLTGFWHGASWNFLLWGIYYAVLLLIEKLFLHKILEHLPQWIRWLYTMVLVLIGWVIFNLTDFAQMSDALKMMFSFRFVPIIDAVTADPSLLYALVYVPLGILCMFPWVKKFQFPDTALGELLKCFSCIVLLAISICFILGSTYNPFIYFRF